MAGPTVSEMEAHSIMTMLVTVGTAGLKMRAATKPVRRTLQSISTSKSATAVRPIADKRPGSHTHVGRKGLNEMENKSGKMAGGALTTNRPSERPGFSDRRKAAGVVMVTVLTVMAVVLATLLLVLERQGQRIAELEDGSRVPRVQSGTIRLDRGDDIYDNSRGCPDDESAWRGHVDRRVEFPEPFASVPEVMAAISGVDHYVDTNLRLVLRVDSIDIEGFSYRFGTWCDTRLASAEMRWMAVAK